MLRSQKENSHLTCCVITLRLGSWSGAQTLLQFRGCSVTQASQPRGVYLEISDQTLREVYHRAQATRETIEAAAEASQEEHKVEENTPSTSAFGIE